MFFFYLKNINITCFISKSKLVVLYFCFFMFCWCVKTEEKIKNKNWKRKTDVVSFSIVIAQCQGFSLFLLIFLIRFVSCCLSWMDENESSLFATTCIHVLDVNRIGLSLYIFKRRFVLKNNDISCRSAKTQFQLLQFIIQLFSKWCNKRERERVRERES